MQTFVMKRFARFVAVIISVMTRATRSLLHEIAPGLHDVVERGVRLAFDIPTASR